LLQSAQVTKTIEAYAAISSCTPDAALLAYASVVDNRSGDPFWVPAR